MVLRISSVIDVFLLSFTGRVPLVMTPTRGEVKKIPFLEFQIFSMGGSPGLVDHNPRSISHFMISLDLPRFLSWTVSVEEFKIFF